MEVGLHPFCPQVRLLGLLISVQCVTRAHPSAAGQNSLMVLHWRFSEVFLPWIFFSVMSLCPFPGVPLVRRANLDIFSIFF